MRFIRLHLSCLSRLKTIAFALFVALALVGGIWAYNHLKSNKKPSADPLQCLPKGAVCLVQTNSFKDLVNKLTHQNLIWKVLGSQNTIRQIGINLQYFDSLAGNDEELGRIISDNLLYHAIYERGKDLDQLMVIGLKEYADIDLVEQFFASHFKKQADLAQPVYVISTPALSQWFITQHNGMVLVSSDLSLLQQATGLDRQGSMAGDLTYTGLLSLDNDRFCKVYLANQGIFSKALLDGVSMLNVDADPNAINFTGYHKPLPSSPLYDLYNKQGQSIGCLHHLPKSTLCFTTIMPGPACFFSDKNVSPLFSKAWQMLNDSALYNIKKETEENFDGELTEVSYLDEAGHVAAMNLIKIKDEDKCRVLLDLLRDSSASVQVNNEGVRAIRLRPTYQAIAGAIGNGGQPALCVWDHYLFVFGSTAEAVAHLSHIGANDVLARDPAFMQFATQNLVPENNMVYYENPVLMKQHHLSGLLTWPGLVEKQDQLSYACFTARNAKSALLVRIGVEYRQTQSADDGRSYLWVLQADTSIHTSVYPFKNHATGENELAFQDARNTLYLANATGSVLWKKRINEPIRSKIYTVDIFRNNKYQLFFSTDNYIHLVDRTGTYVQGYPVKLPARITAPVTIYDYDNNKDYRLFIACADRRIYNYTLYGIRTEGFTPFKTEHEVELPVQYIRVGSSDYLVAVDVQGRIYAFSRKGEGRITLKNMAASGLGSFYTDAGKTIQSTKLVYIDAKQNALCRISFDDKKESVKLDNELAGFQSLYNPVDDDKQMDVILYGDGGIFAYDLFGSKLMETFSASAVYRGVIHHDALDENVLLVWDKAGRKIDVMSPSGKLLRSVRGVTQMPLSYHLFNGDKNYLLLVDGSSLKCTK